MNMESVAEKVIYATVPHQSRPFAMGFDSREEMINFMWEFELGDDDSVESFDREEFKEESEINEWEQAEKDKGYALLEKHDRILYTRCLSPDKDPIPYSLDAEVDAYMEILLWEYHSAHILNRADYKRLKSTDFKELHHHQFYALVTRIEEAARGMSDWCEKCNADGRGISLSWDEDKCRSCGTTQGVKHAPL